ncbi:hypothetical protein Tco_0135415, partial [Tanacetum coccineum]
YVNVVSHDHLGIGTPRNKGIIKSPSKLISPKYQAQLLLEKQDGNSSSPKCIYFVNTITVVRKEDEPEHALKEESKTPIINVGEMGSNGIKDKNKVGDLANDDEEEKGGGWIDVKEPLDLVDVYRESVYESLIKEMLRCSLSYDFRIKRGDPIKLKIPCMIGHKFIADTYIDLDLPMNIMSLTYYNAIRMDGYEYRGQNFIGIG